MLFRSLDIFSRKIVGYRVEERESDDLAKEIQKVYATLLKLESQEAGEDGGKNLVFRQDARRAAISSRTAAGFR